MNRPVSEPKVQLGDILLACAVVGVVLIPFVFALGWPWGVVLTVAFGVFSVVYIGTAIATIRRS